VPGGQAEYLRVPQAHFGPIKVPDGPPDERFVFPSDVLPTAWQAVAYAEVPQAGSLAVFGLGPIGQMCCRIARHQGADPVIGVDLVPERVEMARRHGVETLDLETQGDIAVAIRERTDGRGADAAIDAVGMEAHGAPVAKLAQDAAGFLPDALAQKLIERAGVDRLSALYACIDSVRRGGTVSISGVYGGALDPLPMMQLFDKQLQLRMGQANVRRWSTSSCRWSAMTRTRSAPRTSPRTVCRSVKGRAATRSSRRSRMGRSRSSCRHRPVRSPPAGRLRRPFSGWVRGAGRVRPRSARTGASRLPRLCGGAPPVGGSDAVDLSLG
jgi:threonine dehydrogenase-like Zn-dependent dehydrogenase